MKKIIFPLLITLCFLTSCEKQIDIDVDDLQPKLVVNALGSTDTSLTVIITESRPIFGIHNSGDGFPAVTDASVNLTVNGSVAYTANRDSNRYSLTYIPQGGDRLALSVDRPGHPSATATAVVPDAPLVGPIGPPDTGFSSTTFIIPLSDPSTSADYYYITLRRDDSIFYTFLDNDNRVALIDTQYQSSHWLECRDQLVVDDVDVLGLIDEMGVPTYSGEMLLFSDERFNGQQHNIQVSSPYYGYYDYYADLTLSNTVVHSTYIIEVAAISHDTYLYLKSYQSLVNSDDIVGFLSEPIPLLSNFNGAIGLLGIANKRTFTYHHTFRQ